MQVLFLINKKGKPNAEKKRKETPPQTKGQKSKQAGENS